MTPVAKVVSFISRNKAFKPSVFASMMCKGREIQHRLVFPSRAVVLGWPLENSEWPETSTALRKGEDG